MLAAEEKGGDYCAAQGATERGRTVAGLWGEVQCSQGRGVKSDTLGQVKVPQLILRNVRVDTRDEILVHNERCERLTGRFALKNRG